MASQQTDLFIQHPGFDSLVFNVITASNPEGEMMRAISAKVKPHKIRSFGSENIAIYTQLPDDVTDEKIPEDEDGPFSMFIVPNKNLPLPKRLDIVVSRSLASRYINVALITERQTTLFIGDIPVYVDGDPDPFVLQTI